MQYWRKLNLVVCYVTSLHIDIVVLFATAKSPNLNHCQYFRIYSILTTLTTSVAPKAVSEAVNGHLSMSVIPCY